MVFQISTIHLEKKEKFVKHFLAHYMHDLKRELHFHEKNYIQEF